MKPDSVVAVKSEVTFEPMNVADQRDDIPIETDDLINNFQPTPKNEAIPRIQEKENLINIESATQEEKITLKNIQKYVPQKPTSQVESNNAQLSVNERVHESKEDILKPNSVVPATSEVSFEPLIMTEQRDNIPIEVDKLITEVQPLSSSNEAKPNIQQKENPINIESTILEEKISVNKIQRPVPQKTSSKVETNNEQLSVNQRVPLEGGTKPVTMNSQEIGLATKNISIKVPSEISKVDSEEKELKITSQGQSTEPLKRKVSQQLSLKLAKKV